MEVLAKEHHVQHKLTSVFVNASLVPDEPTVRNYLMAVGKVERFNLRHALLSISSGAMGFYYLRKMFISSYAVLSAVQWILGEHCSQVFFSYLYIIKGNFSQEAISHYKKLQNIHIFTSTGTQSFTV